MLNIAELKGLDNSKEHASSYLTKLTPAGGLKQAKRL